METVLKIALAVICVLLNAFFVASEFSLVAVRKTRVDELAATGNRAAKTIQGALRDLDSYISATQLGITLSSLALGWLGEPVIAEALHPLFFFLPDTTAFYSSHVAAGVVAFLLITFFHIVIGELAPKSVALQKSEQVSMAIIYPLMVFSRLFRPFIRALNAAGNMVVHLLGLSGQPKEQLLHSEEEIKIILSQSAKGGVIERGEAEMANRVFRLGDMRISTVMFPINTVITFSDADTLGYVYKRIIELTHSRYPVFHGSPHSIVGFIHAKDILKVIRTFPEDLRLSELDIIRDIIHVSETERADDVLIAMKKNHIHMAIVNDKSGTVVGVVTMEDIIESIVGEVPDEFDFPR